MLSKIEDLQKLDLEKIRKVSLKEAIEALLSDYNKEEDKESFAEEAQENINTLFSMVREHSSEAITDERKIGKKRGPKKKVKEIESEADTEIRKQKSKKVMEDVLTTVSTKIEECRKAIRDDNKRKRAAEGKEPRPKKSRTTKLKEKLLAIAALIPEPLKTNKDVRNKTEKVLLGTLSDLKKTWRLNIIKPAQDAIKEKFDQMDEQQKLRKAA